MNPILVIAHAFVLTFAMNGMVNQHPTETVVAIGFGVILTLGQILASYINEFIDFDPFGDKNV